MCTISEAVLFVAVIMTPTRELAIQIHKECKKFCKPHGLRVVCVYGGTGISEQVCPVGKLHVPFNSQWKDH